MSMPPSSRHHSPTEQQTSKRSSLAMASGVTGLPSHDRVDSHQTRPGHHSPQASISSCTASRNEPAQSPFVHRSASHHAISSKQYGLYSQNPSPASSVYGGNSPVSSMYGIHPYGGSTPIAANQTLPHVSAPHSSIPPRHAASMGTDPSARGRAHTTSSYHPSSSPAAGKGEQSPFYSLAAASGVVLPEQTGQHPNGQPNYRHLMQDTAIVDYRVSCMIPDQRYIAKSVTW